MLLKIIGLIDLLLIAPEALTVLLAVAVVFALDLKLKGRPDAGYFQRFIAVIEIFPGPRVTLLIVVAALLALPAQLWIHRTIVSDVAKQSVLVSVSARAFDTPRPTTAPPEQAFAPVTVTPPAPGQPRPTSEASATTPSIVSITETSGATPGSGFVPDPVPSPVVSDTPKPEPVASPKPILSLSATPTNTPILVPTPYLPLHCDANDVARDQFGFVSPVSNSIVAETALSFSIQVSDFAYYTIRYANLGHEPGFREIELWSVLWPDECPPKEQGQVRCQRSTDGMDAATRILAVPMSFPTPVNGQPYVFLLELEGGTSRQSACRYITNVTFAPRESGTTVSGP